jgi:hypothetical protein
MHFIRSMLIPTAALATAVVYGCGGERRPAVTTTTETTAATTTNELAETQRDRNEARAQLAEERTARETDRQRFANETEMRREHDELETRALDAIEKAGNETQALRDKAVRSGAKQRAEIDKTLEEAKQHKTKLFSDLRRLHAGLGNTSWDAFKTDVQSTINELDRVLSKSTEPTKGTETKTPPMKK